MKTRKGISDKRSALRAVLSALPSRFGLPHATRKEKQRRIRRITVETERTYIVRSRSIPCIHWCAQCGAEVQMAGVDVLARNRGVSELAIYQLIESRALHFTEALDELGVSRKGAKKGKTEGAKKITQPFAPSGATCEEQDCV